MNFFSQRYVVNFRDGSRKKKTALEILKLIKRDSKSNYDWFATSDELVRICKISDFPQDVATFIEVAVLNCYANIEHSVLEYPDSKNNVVFCYNALIEKEEYNELRKKYMNSVLNSVITYGLSDEPRLFPLGDTYNNMCFEWKNTILNDFVNNNKKIINLDELYKIYSNEFESMIKESESNHVFDDDEKNFFEKNSFVKVLSDNLYLVPDIEMSIE